MVTVLAVDPGRLTSMLLPLEAVLEATLDTVEAVAEAPVPVVKTIRETQKNNALNSLLKSTCF